MKINPNLKIKKEIAIEKKVEEQERQVVENKPKSVVPKETKDAAVSVANADIDKFSDKTAAERIDEKETVTPNTRAEKPQPKVTVNPNQKGAPTQEEIDAFNAKNQKEEVKKEKAPVEPEPQKTVNPNQKGAPTQAEIDAFNAKNQKEEVKKEKAPVEPEPQNTVNPNQKGAPTQAEIDEFLAKNNQPVNEEIALVEPEPQTVNPNQKGAPTQAEIDEFLAKNNQPVNEEIALIEPAPQTVNPNTQSVPTQAEIDAFLERNNQPEIVAETSAVYTEPQTVNPNQKGAPTQAEVDAFLERNNAQPVEQPKVDTPAQEPKNETAPQFKPWNDTLSNEEKLDVYNNIVNSVPDGEARKKALASTGLDFSFIDKTEKTNANDNPVTEWVATAAENAENWIEKAVVDVGEWLKNAANNTGEWIENAAKNVGEWFKKVINSPGEWVQNAINNTGEWIKNAVKDVGEWLKNAANNVGEWVDNAVNNVGDWLKNAASNIGNFFKNIFSGKNNNKNVETDNNQNNIDPVNNNDIIDNKIKDDVTNDVDNNKPIDTANNQVSTDKTTDNQQIEDLKSIIKDEIGDIADGYNYQQLPDGRILIISDNGPVGSLTLNDAGQYEAQITVSGDNYYDKIYSISSEGGIEIDNKLNTEAFFKDFSNEYDKTTGTFKDGSTHFPNGVDDVINYLNGSSQLAELVIGAIAVGNNVAIEDLSGSLQQQLIDANLIRVDNNGNMELQGYVAALADFLGDNAKGDLSSSTAAAWQLEGVVANLLEKTGNTDLLRSLYENQNLNMESLAYLVSAANQRAVSNDGQNNVSLDGQLFNVDTQQGATGDCWNLSSLIAAVGIDSVKEFIQSCITIDKENGIATVTTPDGSTSSFTFNEIGMSDDLSNGDYDIRLFEMHIRNREISEGKNFNGGGWLDTFVKDITGMNVETYYETNAADNIDEILGQIRSGNYISQCSLSESNKDIAVYDENGNKVNGYTDNDGNTYSFVDGHAYAVLGADDKYVYIKNPWDSSQKLKISIDDFKKLSYESISVDKFNNMVEQAKVNAQVHQEQMAYYNQLLESYGDKELTKDDMNDIIAALAEKGIDYYNDIAKTDNPYVKEPKAELSQEQKWEYYNNLLETYGDKELTQEDINEIKNVLSTLGIDYEKDIKNNPIGENDKNLPEFEYQKNKDGSATIFEYQFIDGKKVKVGQKTIGKNGDTVSEVKFEYNDDGSMKHVTNISTDSSGNTYEYVTDCETGKRELTQVTNKDGQAYVVKNYQNSDGSLNWQKLQQDGWGTSISGTDAQDAFRDLQNGATLDEIIRKYKPKTSNNNSSTTTGTTYTPGAAGSGQVWRGNVDNYQGGFGYQNIDSYGNGQWVGHNDWGIAPGVAPGSFSGIFSNPSGGGGGGGASY